MKQMKGNGSDIVTLRSLEIDTIELVEEKLE